MIQILGNMSALRLSPLLLVCLWIVCFSPLTVNGFSIQTNIDQLLYRILNQSPKLHAPKRHPSNPQTIHSSSGLPFPKVTLYDRRKWFQSSFTAMISGAAIIPSNIANAEGDVAASLTQTPIIMKEFVDPQGLFTITVPNDFYTLRRSAKGDLPDSKTGKGRRGSSIFTAGNMKKAEVVAVERFPTRVLLEENGIDASGSLSTFPDLGESSAIANLVNLRRERDRPGMSNSIILPESVKLSDDNKELTFAIKAEIEVQKPELLMETYGVDRLFRVTLGKVSLRSNDGNIMAVFASALESDFKGPDGTALQETVDSFVAIERPREDS